MTSGSANSPQRTHRQGGYAFLMLLVLVAGVVSLAGHSVEWGASSHRREAERELLRVGAAYEKALLSYTATQPRTDTLPAGPSSLDQLLKDDRQPTTLRHIRKLYQDPMTGGREWGLVRSPTGSIWGVYSLAPGKPLAQKNVPQVEEPTQGTDSYREWVFGLPQARNMNPPGAQTTRPIGPPGKPPTTSPTNNFTGAPA
jgi:hypothetical protein